MTFLPALFTLAFLWKEEREVLAKAVFGRACPFPQILGTSWCAPVQAHLVGDISVERWHLDARGGQRLVNDIINSFSYL